MSELIDRQALKAYVNSLSTHPLNEWDTWGVLAAIDKQPTVNPWHRVEDGLPDKHTQCLVADADGKCAVGYYRYDCEAWDSPAFGWVEAEDRKYIDYIPMGIGKVVAWMPIEPPTGTERSET